MEYKGGLIEDEDFKKDGQCYGIFYVGFRKGRDFFSMGAGK